MQWDTVYSWKKKKIKWQQLRQKFGYSGQKGPEFKNLAPFSGTQSQPASRDSCVCLREKEGDQATLIEWGHSNFQSFS